MNEQKHYRDELLEWCQTVEFNWDHIIPRFSRLFDHESIKEWEESLGQLKTKLQEEEEVDIEDYETAKNLYDQFELLYGESIAYKQALEIISENSLEIQIDEGNLETNAYKDELGIESEQYIDMEELTQYRDDLLKWCNNLYINWNRRKPRLSNLVDSEILEGWEGMFSRLKLKLQEDLSLDYEDYETAAILYKQLEMLHEESYSNPKESAV
jgi:hypothetical protein